MYIFSGIFRKLYKYYVELVLAVSPDLIIWASWYRTVVFGDTVSFLSPNKALVAHTFCNASHITDLILIRVTSFFAIRTTLIEMLISRAFLIKFVKIVFGVEFDGKISYFENAFRNFPLILQVLRGLQLPSVSRTKPLSQTHFDSQISGQTSWTNYQCESWVFCDIFFIWFFIDLIDIIILTVDPVGFSQVSSQGDPHSSQCWPFGQDCPNSHWSSGRQVPFPSCHCEPEGHLQPP